MTTAFESNGEPCKTWQVINDLTSRKVANSSIREIKLDGISLTKSPDVSNAFNDHFLIDYINWT